MARFDNENDLVALRVPADQDRLSGLILNYFGGFFKVSIPQLASTREKMTLLRP
jgi:hypothetical protein